MSALTEVEAKALLGRKAENGIEWTQDMLTEVLKYTDRVQQVVQSTGGMLFVEQRLNIGWLTGEEGAKGTADTVVVIPREELIVADLKFGRGVEVSPKQNKQLMIYALGALRKFAEHGPYKSVRIVISQPRIANPWDEWQTTPDELEAFAREVQAASHGVKAARICWTSDTGGFESKYLNPSDKACKWCLAKASRNGLCPALSKAVKDAVAMVPASADGDKLGEALGMSKMVESWIKAVRAEVERRLLDGEPVNGYKIVKGRQGNRAWVDTAQVEDMLKGFRLKTEEMYDLSLISPTTAEKLVEQKVIGSRQWPKLAELITRAEGGLSVAPESDERAAVVVGAPTDGFNDLTAAPGGEPSDDGFADLTVEAAPAPAPAPPPAPEGKTSSVFWRNPERGALGFAVGRVAFKKLVKTDPATVEITRAEYIERATKKPTTPEPSPEDFV
jgi:hypothetical protein